MKAEVIQCNFNIKKIYDENFIIQISCSKYSLYICNILEMKTLQTDKKQHSTLNN